MYTGRIFTLLTGSTALSFVATCIPPAARVIQILPMNQHTWQLITFRMKWLQFTDHRRFWKCCPSTCRYLLQLIISLKTQIQQSFLHLQHTRHQLSLHGLGLYGLDMDSMNSSSNYFVHLCIPASGTTLHQKRMSIVDHLTFNNRL
jgi:hypothetical protein